MSLVLRPYQEKIISDARQLMMSGCRRFVIVSPTGSGKTALTTQMLQNAEKKGLNSQFLVHRRELIKQSSKSFAFGGVPHGIIAAGFDRNYTKKIQIASVQTLARRLNIVPHPKLVVYDEAHHISAGTWDKIYKTYKDAFHIGLTATPCRLDGKGLKKHFDEIIYGPRVSWLIENNYLTPYKLFAPSKINRESMKIRMGDFRTSDSEQMVNNKTITGSAIKEYMKVCPKKQAIIFCVSIAHSKMVVSEFKRQGIIAEHLDAETPADLRDKLMRDFSERRIQVLSNVNLFSEGVDVPGLDAVIMLRPTMSLSMYLQQVGRVLRTAPGKDTAYILDHVGNVLEHGLPDEEREWSLDGATRKGRGGDGEDGPAVYTCEMCFLTMPPHLPKCPECGHVREKKPQREIEQVDGTLEEIDKNAILQMRKKEQGQAQSMDDLVELGKKRGYKNPRGWAKHIFNARQAKKIKGGW